MNEIEGYSRYPEDKKKLTPAAVILFPLLKILVKKEFLPSYTINGGEKITRTVFFAGDEIFETTRMNFS